MVTDHKIIKKYKAKYGTLWFPEGAYSSVVLKRYDGQTYYADLLGDQPTVWHYWINKKSIKPVEEMDTDTFRIFELIRQPVVIAFVDLNSKDKKVFKASQNLVDNILPKVAPAFFHGAVIAYADNNQYKQHRKMLGVTTSKTPALTINNNEQKVLPFPDNLEMNEDNISKWLSDFVKGKLVAKDAHFGEIIDAEIKYMMPDITQLKQKTFVDKIYEEEQDAVLFIYSSHEENDVQRLIAKRYNELAQRFSQMKINTVKFYSFDKNTDGQPPRIDT